MGPLVIVVFLLGSFFTFLLIKLIQHQRDKDLNDRNKALTALRKLEEIMVASLKLEDVAQRVTDAIAAELGFDIGVLALIDDRTGTLRRVAMSRTQLGLESHKYLPVPYQQIVIPLSNRDNILIQAMVSKKKMVTHDMYQLFRPALDEQTAKNIQQTIGLQTSIVYPIFAKEQVIGVMIFSTKQAERELSVYKLQAIEKLVEVMGVALDNAKTYEQLFHQNKLFKALRSLDIVALSTTELESLCQAIVDVVHKELGYFFGAIALIDEDAKGLKRVAISQDPNLHQTLEQFSIEYKKQKAIPLSRTDNLLIQAINDRQSKFTDKLYDIQIGIQPEEMSNKLQQVLGMKGYFVYPLVTKDRVIGVVYYVSLVEKEKLSQFEFDIMEEFTREVARVLDNVLLYQNLRETSEELIQANQKLKQLDKLKDDFVSVASHELRTPMTAIRSYSWMALNRPDVPLSEKMKKYLSRVIISTERLINLVNDMLNVSRIEAGSIEVNPKAFEIDSLVADVVEEVAPKITEKNLNLHILHDKIPQVFADPDKVHEILLNLIGNSLKFTPAGGQITVSFFTDGQVLETSVKDSGAGIAKEDLGRLFQKFGRLDNSYVAMGTAGGTGLGLFISKKLVELMRGKIWASSEGLGKGATFTFSLPIASKQVLENSDSYRITPRGEVKGLEPVAI